MDRRIVAGDHRRHAGRAQRRTPVLVVRPAGFGAVQRVAALPFQTGEGMERGSPRPEVDSEALRSTGEAHELPSVAYLDTGTLIREAYRGPHGSLTAMRPIRPIAPYDQNPENWPKLAWRDLHTGEPIRLTWSKKRGYSVSELPVQTYHRVIARFLRHPEVKADGGDGVGVLQPLHIVVTDVHQIRHIGKEANRLDEVQVLGLQADTYLQYQDADANKKWLRQRLEKIPRKLVSQYAGLSERQIARFLNGTSRLRLGGGNFPCIHFITDRESAESLAQILPMESDLKSIPVKLVDQSDARYIVSVQPLNASAQTAVIFVGMVKGVISAQCPSG